MKMKRIVSALSIGALTALTLTSCILPNKDPAVNRDLTYTYTEEQYETLKKDMDNFESYLKGSSQVDLYGAWNEINRQTEAIVTCRTIEYLNYNKTGSEDAYDKYLYFQDIVTEIVKWMDSMYQPIYDSSYRDEFYAGMTEEEIQEKLNSVKPDRYYELDGEIEDILKEYDELSDSEVQTKAPALYEKLVKLYNEEATLLGYSDYMSYAYKDVYSREYTPAEVNSFTGLVKEYILPLTKKYYEAYVKDMNGLSNMDYTTVENFTEDYFETNMTLITSYAEYVGDDYLSTFNHLWAEEDGGYIIIPTQAEEDSALDGAFTTFLYSLNEPVMYFGPNYQDTFTFIHEFGHYNAYYVNRDKDESQSYDLAETQSQGDEMLFLAYIDENNIFNDAVTTAIYDYTVYDALVTVLYAAMVNEFEYKVYSDLTYTSKDYDTVFDTVLAEFGGESYYSQMNLDPSTYWKRVCLDNPGYYISYAMSKIPSLEILAMANDSGLDAAKDTYKKTYKSDDYSQEEFLNIIEAAGLKSPFSEDAFTLLNKLK